MISPRVLRLLIYSLSVLVLISLKIVLIDSLGMSTLVALDFEVYGRVQGVCFRKMCSKNIFGRLSIFCCQSILYIRSRSSLPTSPNTYLHVPTNRTLVEEFFYRLAYTQRQGKKLGLCGWCMNTERGTVVGQLQGEKSKIEEMKMWLQHKGSPNSSIEKAEFRNEKEIPELSFKDFNIRK